MVRTCSSVKCDKNVKKLITLSYGSIDTYRPTRTQNPGTLCLQAISIGLLNSDRIEHLELGASATVDNIQSSKSTTLKEEKSDGISNTLLDALRSATDERMLPTKSPEKKKRESISETFSKSKGYAILSKILRSSSFSTMNLTRQQYEQCAKEVTIWTMCNAIMKYVTRADINTEEEDHSRVAYRENLTWALKNRRTDMLRLMFTGLEEVLKCLLVTMRQDMSTRLDAWIHKFDPIPVIRDVMMCESMNLQTLCLSLCVTLSKCGSRTRASLREKMYVVFERTNILCITHQRR